MPRPAKTEPSSRLNLEMAASTRERLESLRLQTHADSLTEVVRRALSLYDFVWAQKEKGGKLIVKDRNGEREVVVL